MRKEKSRDAARSRRSKENHEFYELAKLLPLPAAITSQLDFLDKASIIRLTISFLKLRQFSVNGHPPWAPDFTTLGSANPYTSTQTTLAGSEPSSTPGDEIPTTTTTTTTTKTTELNDHKSLVTTTLGNSITPSNVAFHPPASLALPLGDTYQHHHHHHHHTNIEQQSVRSFIKTNAASLFDVHQGTHILQSLDGFAFAIGRDGRFLYISETVSMYLGLSQVEMTGSSVFDYTHQQDHAELALQLGIPYTPTGISGGNRHHRDSCSPRPPGSVQSQYSAASNETSIEDHMTHSVAAVARKRLKTASGNGGRAGKLSAQGSLAKTPKKAIIKSERQELVANDHVEDTNNNRRVSKPEPTDLEAASAAQQTNGIASGARDLTVADVPTSARTVDGDPLVRQFCIRMKSTLTKRGCQHFKSSGYRVVHVVAHLRSYQSNDHGHLMDPLDDPANLGDQQQAASGTNATSATTKSAKQGKRRGSKAQKSANTSESKLDDQEDSSTKGDNNNNNKKERPGSKLKIIGMVAVAIALPPPSINELRLESDTFVLRLGLDLKITHVEPKITELLHYPMDLLAGRSLYSFIHPADLEQARTCHRDLLQKGQMMSGYYRLLARTGGYIWIQTCATLICNTNTTAPMLGSSTLGPAGSTSSPSPLLQQQQQQQLLMSDNEPLAMSGRGPGHAHNQPAYFLQAGTPTSLSATSFESQIMEHQQHQQFQTQPPHQQQQQQEQCVIFVNYMITNVIETQEILDVCQSKDFMPVQLTNFSGLSQQQQTVDSKHVKSNNINHNSKYDNETTNEYVSPGSSCSSPCLTVGGNLRPAAAGGSSIKTGNGGVYLPPSAAHTANIINLSSSSSTSLAQPQQQPGRHWRADQQASSESPSGRHTSGTSSKANRRQAAKVSRAHEQSQSQAYPPGGSHAVAAAGITSESGFGGSESSPVGAVASYAAAAAAAVAVAAASGSAYDTATRAFRPATYHATSATDDGGGNPLAMASKHSHAHHLDPTGVVASSWHQQQQQQQGQQQQQHHHPGAHAHQHAYLAAGHHHTPAIYSDATSNNHQQVAAQAASDHYLASMERSSIYKAATFAAAGLAGGYAAYPSVAATYHHHQHPLSQQLEQHEQQQQQQHHSHHHHTQQQYQQSQHAAASQQHYQTAAAAAATVYSAHQHLPPWF